MTKIINEELGRELLTYFEGVQLMQSNGVYGVSNPSTAGEYKCCFGAHLAHFLLGETDYEYGAVGLAMKLDCTVRQLELLLLQAGARVKDDIMSPFDVEDWDLAPYQVVKNLMEIEEMPEDDLEYSFPERERSSIETVYEIVEETLKDLRILKEAGYVNTK